jgi:hypothetical protein
MISYPAGGSTGAFVPIPTFVAANASAGIGGALARLENGGTVCRLKGRIKFVKALVVGSELCTLPAGYAPGLICQGSGSLGDGTLVSWFVNVGGSIFIETAVPELKELFISPFSWSVP